MKIIYLGPLCNEARHEIYRMGYDQFVHVHSAHLLLEANLMPPHKRALLLPMLSVLAHHLTRDYYILSQS